MRPVQQKMVIVLSLMATLHLAEACFDCGCGDVLPFFDYASIVAETPEPEVTAEFRLNIMAEEVSYLAMAAPHFHWNNTALACSCSFNGDSGPKYTVEKLNIYADRAFNDTLPSGASLNSLFLVLNGDALSPLEENAALNYFWSFDGEVRAIPLIMHEKPLERNTPFRFRVELLKSDGNVLNAETEEVVFQ